MSDITSEPDRIERDLDQTRSRLGSHLSEFQGRLSPGQVLDDLMRYFRGREGADFGRSLVSSVRANPLPVALTGIGLTWLMASNPRPGTSATATKADKNRVSVYSRAPILAQDNEDTVESRMRAAEQSVARQDGEPEHAYAARLDGARGQTIGLTRQATETTESFSQRIHDVIATAKQTIGDSAHGLRDQVGDKAGAVGSSVQGVAHSVGSTAQGAAQRTNDALTRGGQAMGRAGGTLMTALTENPVLLGALSLAAGALLGGLLPQTDQEEAALGDMAGQARVAANNLAQDVADRGSHVAHAVIDAGHDSVQAQGFADKSTGNLVDAALSGDLASKIKDVAADVLRTGDEAIRTELPGQTENKAESNRV